MKWRLARATFMVGWPFVVIACVIAALTASGSMRTWDAWMLFVVASGLGMWAAPTWRYHFGPKLDATSEDDGGPRSMRVQIGVPIGEMGSTDPCEGCGQVHEPVIYVPLPDGTALVSHKDRDGCDWATHVEELDAVPVATRFHMDFECARRVNQAQ